MDPAHPVDGERRASVERARRVARLVARGTVNPRDANLWAGATGLKVLPERKVDARARFGIGARQATNIVRAVLAALAGDGADAAPVTVGAAADVEPLALAAAEAELTAQDRRDEVVAAAEAARARAHGEAPRRGGAANPLPGDVRIRRHRLARRVAARAEMLSHAPDLSLRQPYLIVPWALPPTLWDLVPPAQRRRSGRPPDEGWLMGMVRELEDSYRLRDGRAPDLATVVVWALGRYPTSPDPAGEVRGLRVASLVAREAGQMRSYWLAQRVTQLSGPFTPDALYAAQDACITLRNHGYVEAANALVRRSLQRTRSQDLTDAERHATREPLLSQAQFNLSHGYVGSLNPETAAAARRVADQMVASSVALGSWPGAGLRARFEAEFARARLRSRQTRERFWLHDGAVAAFEDADAVMRWAAGIRRAQWELLRMAVGVSRRDVGQVTAGAEGYRRVAEASPWVLRDHPSEVREYGVYAQRAKAALRGAGSALEWQP